MLRETSVKNGRLRGVPGNDPRVTVYKGIPFGAPPVGENRWKAPKPCKDWEGVFDASRFAPISIQDQPAMGDDIYCREWHVDKDIPMDEDCLYLNVWTPANTTEDRLPVLVWYFGGAFEWGYTPEMEFNGERLARRGIIVVSINYRLGVLGFLAHPELTAEDSKAPSNFGLLDQKLGLRWVYDNISSFGGDPDNITIAGQSAGGGSVLHHITDEDNFGIIRGAAIISGFIRIEGDDILRHISLREAEEKGTRFFEFLGVNSLEEARGLDALYIRDKYAQWADTGHPRFSPIDDNATYKEDPYELFCKNRKADIPIIAGYTADETIADIEGIVGQSVHNAIGAVLSAGSHGRHYIYEFDPDIPGYDDPGAFHSVDLWFWFETLNMCWRPFRGHHYDLARVMCNYLAGFVKNHDPNGIDDDGSVMPQWNPAKKDDHNTIRFI